VRPAVTHLPDIVTHTFHPQRGPFRNLCALSLDDAERIVDEMRAVGRCMKPDYLARRHATERWLRDARTAKLGATPLEHPIYFFVGDLDDGRDPARPHALTLMLAALPPSAITFTYGDSMSSHEAFTLAEITAIVAERGMPESFVELQLWDRAPLAAYR
jgi:hypothetical protein